MKVYTSNVNEELRYLMDSYSDKSTKLEKERIEAKEDGDIEGELTAECLQRQNRIMIAELFQVMKNLGVLDEEEIEFGSVKRIELML